MPIIIDEWSSVKAPPAPRLKGVTIDLETTALLMLDLIKQTCNQEHRPRCLESLPNVKKLLTQASCAVERLRSCLEPLITCALGRRHASRGSVRF
jgi:hypothetical protein